MMSDSAVAALDVRLLISWALVLGLPYPVARSIWPRRPLLDQVVLTPVLAVLLVAGWGYVLAVLGALTPSLLLVAYAVSSLSLGTGAFLRLCWRGGREGGSAARVWPMLLLAGALGFFVRWHDGASHLSLGGNDPWGHLVLAKGVSGGNISLLPHHISFYPRGFHFLAVAVARVAATDLYELFRFSGPVLALYTVLAGFCVARRAAGALGGVAAAALLAVPPFRHWVLACGDTATEPDTLAFGMLAALSLLALEMVEHAHAGRRYANSIFLVVAGWVALFVVHPPTAQLATFLLVGLVALSAIMYPPVRRLHRLVPLGAGALFGVVFGVLWYLVTEYLSGVRFVPHLFGQHALTLAGHGLDAARLFLGTGFWGAWEDAAWLLSALLVLLVGVRRKNVGVAYVGLACLLMGYSALTGALHLGEHRHARPYYAVTQAWAFGVLVGICVVRAARRSPRLASLALAAGCAVCATALLALRWPPGPGSVFASLLLFGASVAARPDLRRLGVAVSLCCLGGVWALSPRYAFYPRLGYEENVAAALEVARRHPAGDYEVYSQSLTSYTVTGDAFPIQSREKAIIEPDGTHYELEELLSRNPGEHLLVGGPVYVFLERTPYVWRFHAFDAEGRAEVMAQAWEWMERYESIHGRVDQFFDKGEVIVYRFTAGL